MGKKKKPEVKVHYKAIMVDIDTLKPNEYNFNVMSDFEMESLESGVSNDAFYGAVFVQKGTNRIIDGEHRFLAGQRAGMKQIPVIYLDVTDEKAKKLTIALNEKKGTSNEDKLRMVLDDLVSKNTDMDALALDIGIEADEIDSLLQQTKESLDSSLKDNSSQLDNLGGNKGSSGGEELDDDGSVVIAPGVDGKEQFACLFLAPDAESYSKLKALFGSKHSDDLLAEKLLEVVEYYLSKHPDERADVEATMAVETEDDFDFEDEDEKPKKKPAKAGKIKAPFKKSA